MITFKTLFLSDYHSRGSICVKQNRKDESKITADKFIHLGGYTYEHKSFILDTASGRYKEYYSVGTEPITDC